MESESRFPRTVKEFEGIALRRMNKHGKFYFSAGALTKETPTNNEEVFKKIRIQPRVLRDVSKTNTSCKVLNSLVSSPIGVAPVAFHFLAHEEAETATAEACAKEECIFVLSCVTSIKMEEVSRALEKFPVLPVVWLQVYVFKDRSLTLDLMKRAENCGFSAIVVTVDSPIRGLWKAQRDDDFDEMIKDKSVNIPSTPRKLLDASITFEDLKWVVKNTTLPVVVKGIMRGEDALAAAHCGVSAIFVSNHGERQIYNVISTIDVLSEVVHEVAKFGIEVYLDGGIRSGSDIFVALALGAKAVFVGRPAIWGLAAGGEEGVRRVLRILKDELKDTMKLAGISKIEDIKNSLSVRRML